jgi:hypothetical protein
MPIRKPDMRRPSASDIDDATRRPMMPTQIIKYDASAGVILSTITNRIVIHSKIPTDGAKGPTADGENSCVKGACSKRDAG